MDASIRIPQELIDAYGVGAVKLAVESLMYDEMWKVFNDMCKETMDRIINGDCDSEPVGILSDVI